MITSRLRDRSVKFTRLLCLPQEASSSKILLLTTVLAILGALTGCADAHLPGLTSITVTPANSTIDTNQTQQYAASGTFSDGTTRDLTNLVTWSSSNTSVVTISSTGLAFGQSQGSSMISATLNTADGPVTGTTALSVVVALTSLTITSVNPSIANGTSLQLTATGIFSDGSKQNLTTSVSWSSSSNGVATVNTSGLVTAVGVGTRTITATQGAVSATTSVTVTSAVLTSITITQPNVSIANGTSEQLIATGNFSDGTTQNLTAFVTWTSSAPAVATVGNAAGSQGFVMGSGAGSTTITATVAGVSGTTTVTVTTATLISITITPPKPSIANGTTVQLIATGIFSDRTTQDLTASATWNSSSTAMATVSSSGLVRGTAVGMATITATQAGVSGSTTVTVTAATLTSITITPPNPSIANGTSVQLTATGTFSDGTTQNLTASVTWLSSAQTIVSNAAGSQGLVTGNGEGSATITATLAGVSGMTTATVTAATLTSIIVTPPNPSIAKGTSVQLTATGVFSDGTTQNFTSTASWSPSSNSFAPVNPTGLATGTAVGTETVTATQAGVSGSTTVTVTAATLTSIVVTPPNPSIAKGTAVQLTATGTFSDGSTQDLTTTGSWASSSGAIATVNSLGLATGTGAGSATITVTQAGVSGSTTITVTSAVLASIVITPTNPIISAHGTNTTVPLTATGIFSDGSMQDLKNTVSWTSSSDAIATVEPSGLVKGQGVGTATITATVNGVSGATTVTVQ